MPTLTAAQQAELVASIDASRAARAAAKWTATLTFAEWTAICDTLNEAGRKDLAQTVYSAARQDAA